MQTQNGGDTAVLRRKGLQANQVKIMVEEEDSRDGERDHAGEKVGTMMLWSGAFDPVETSVSGAGVSAGFFEHGRITNFNHQF